ncbi:MAG TPA: FAD-binding oxidoreductase, partial [Acidimicrobiales bacterium]|nr:FAD-binding oxidoreductase [Acidimicrobiales bacterium]
MSEHFDVAVVGGGIVGAAVAFHTARLGGRVVVLDSSPASGATGHSSAIVRVHQPDLALAPLSYLGWQEFSQWEDVVGRPSPFRVTGCVHDVSPAGGPDPADVGRLRTMGWRCSIVGAAELAARYRSVAWPAETNAVFEPDAGWADPVACRDQYLDRVEELGGSVRRGALVSDVIVHKDVVRGVHVAGGPVGADAVVLATGAWSAFDALGPAP